MMIRLSPVNTHWLAEFDDPGDYCAHGSVEFFIDEHQVVSIDSGEWCVSAAALYLLRSLERSHTPQAPVSEHMIPCCGHSMFRLEGHRDVCLTGCSSGIDWEVIHQSPDVLLRLTDGTEFRILQADYANAVWDFSDKVREFYKQSKPKIELASDDDWQGFQAFMSEWDRRRLDSQ